jgi:diguanylate cyclase (GGDEF)-like protein/PAS domain S-box-containing protein
LSVKGSLVLLFIYQQLKFSYKSKLAFCLLWLTFLLMLSHRVDAKVLSSPLKFTNISTEQGLSQSYVFSIDQDRQGFLWIATEDGLNRYDGKNFTHYRHHINDKGSIADNFIRKVFIDNQGSLWVGTNNGLSRYNNESNDFNNYLAIENDNNSLRDNVIWNIYQDKHNIIWISSAQGLHQYNEKTDSFKRIELANSKIKLTEVRTFFQDSNNNYWIGTYDQSIYLANNNFSYAISLQTKNKWNLNIPAKSLFDIKEIDNQYWLATEQGLYVVNNNYQLTKHFTRKNTANQLLADEVRAIALFDDTHVWLGTKNGLNIINILNDNLESYQNNGTPKSLSENWILTLFKDKVGNMWLGNLATGLDKYNPSTSLFAHKLFNNKNDNIIINSIAQTSDNKIWFESDTIGLNYLAPQTKKLQHINIAIEKNIDFIRSDNNDLWLLSYTGELYQLNNQNQRLNKHKQWKKQANYNSSFNFIVVKNQLWFIDNEGNLVSYNPKKQNFSRYAINKNDKLRALNRDIQQNIWLTSNNNHIYQFNTDSKKFQQLNAQTSSSFNINETMSIAIDNNWLWLSSYSQGIMVVNKNDLSTTTYNENNGLINNNSNAILLDKQGNAWLSATNGISKITPNNNNVQNFSKDYGLTDNEFLRGSALVSTQGLFYFGGLNGFQQFSPSKVLNLHQAVPTPILSNLFIANKKIAVTQSIKKNQPLTDKTATKLTLSTDNLASERSPFTIAKQLNQLTTLTLAYQQSPFSLEFTAPNAKLPNQIHYRYKLVGLDKQWIDADINNQKATYTHLSAGQYRFVVQAFDRHNPSLMQTKQLNIEILPPWWLSKQALFVYALLIILTIIYFIIQTRHHHQYHIQIQQSEERLKLSLWGSGDEMWDWNITSNKIYRSNIWGNLEFPQDGIRNLSLDQNHLQQAIIQPPHIPQGAALTSLSYQEKLEQFKQHSNIHPQDFTRVYQTLERHIENTVDNEEHFESAYRIKNKENSWVWILDRGKIVERDNQQQPTRMTGTIKDISQLKSAEERLKLFAQCIESISDAVIIYNRQFKVVDVNKAYQKITRETKSKILGRELNFELYSNNFTQSVKKHVISQGNWHGELEERRNNNEVYSINLNIDVIRDENNNISHFVGVFSDISERKENEAELRKLANLDTLTSLPNRSCFQANQNRLVKGKIPHALLVFDLDNFKKINDSLGHELGDTLLCRVAERITESVRKHDSVYRLGGDEFGLIIENTNDIHTITSIAKNILTQIAKPLKIKNHELVLHSSIGVVLYPEDGASPQELLKNADTAMYHAKSKGGNQYQFFNDSMNKRVVKRLQIEHLIRFGLKHDYFSVFYQPKIEISSGKIAGMEALVRFEHPTKGIVSPITFIPVSEETGQIIQIGEVVLRKACFATKAWVDAGLFDGRIAVNLSAVQFTQPNLVDVIASILKETQLPAQYLELEITEGTVMDSPQNAIDIMQQIRAMGIHLALDDFGTGYSSLAYLKKFPLNTLKIDKAFVDDIEHSEQGRNMVATIVTIAHNLGLQVVAEGVEHNLQLNFLASLACEQLQGYLYSKPLAKQDFSKYLLAHQITQKSTNFTQ